MCHTRPDIAYGVGLISRHMEKPTTSHLSAASIVAFQEQWINMLMLEMKLEEEEKMELLIDSRSVNDKLKI
ncbi:hypothetical protein MTR_3g437540 [Medicago truncatula]|uniref:Uncharacterized protein n=1 Tax=Medicago truncatula TaxID=3880 RepID=A0A072V5F3_MEDTR|nr:hypothetical protein MTR_3g437540 [Medicago truncatula]